MASSALTRLEARLVDVDELMAAHAAVGGVQRGRRRGVEGLNRAAALMLCAHFEGYIEDLFREAVGAFHESLDPEILVSRFHNPWPNHIDELFEVIGLRRVSRNISLRPASRELVVSNLEDLVRIRNRIAHGTTNVRVSKANVTRWRKYVEGFARQIDEKVALHLLTVTGQLPWVPATIEA